MQNLVVVVEEYDLFSGEPASSEHDESATRALEFSSESEAPEREVDSAPDVPTDVETVAVIASTSRLVRAKEPDDARYPISVPINRLLSRYSWNKAYGRGACYNFFIAIYV